MVNFTEEDLNDFEEVFMGMVKRARASKEELKFTDDEIKFFENNAELATLVFDCIDESIEKQRKEGK